MTKALLLLLTLAATLAAQTAETHVFRAKLSPANEVPPIAGLAASGTATVVAHIVRNNSGEITSGSVDFYVNHVFPGETTFTGLHIHTAPAGTNGGVNIDTGITGQNTVASSSGSGTISRQAPVIDNSRGGIAALTGMLSDPSGYYVNLHTTVNPGGAIRGQLEKAQYTVLMGRMSPRNEVPPIENLNATGLGAVTAITTRDASGNLTSGEVIFLANYSFPAQIPLTGFHIHPGGAGINGPVSINTGLTRMDSDPSGGGRLSYRVEVAMTNAAAVSTLEGLFSNPQGYYINLHTADNPGGAIRSQLRTTELTTFQSSLSPANEVPAIAGLDASAFSVVRIHSMRGENGAIEAATVTFDLNHRFPGETEFTGLHIHDGAVGANGPVRVDSRMAAFTSATGFGNITETNLMEAATALATLNSMMVTPDRHYINLHTRVNAGGAVRSQMGTVRTASPVLSGMALVGSAVITGAPGALVSLYGNNMATIAGGLEGWQGTTLPTTLNGVELTMENRALPLLYVSPGQVNAQVPFETTDGVKDVVLKIDGRTSNTVRFNIVRSSPAIFTYEQGGMIVRNSDFSLIGPDNPAVPGDVLLMYSTGLGQTTPAQETGKFATYPPVANTSTVRVTVGGTEAELIYSMASPGFVGLYQTAFRVPRGVTGRSVPVILEMPRTGGSSQTTMVVR
jgi:uncharacterized protein (TIGR03437 family)